MKTLAHRKAQPATGDEFLKLLRQMKNDPDDASPSPGTRMVAKLRPRMNRMSRAQREQLFAEAMTRIYSGKNATVKAKAYSR
jgi:hypothetical protein